MRKPPIRRFGFRSARSWLRHSHASLHHSLPALVFASQSPYSGWQTVVYNRNVMCHFLILFMENSPILLEDFYKLIGQEKNMEKIAFLAYFYLTKVQKYWIIK
jgi:hypothetical protein